MALQISLADTDVGLPAPKAYARIVGMNFDTKSGNIVVTVDVHATAAARTAGKAPIRVSYHGGIVGVDLPSLDDTLPGIRAVLYGWLKTLPDFAGAIDA